MPFVIVSSVVVGCVYALLTTSLVLIFRGTGVLNFAQGQLFALGAFLFVWITANVVDPFWIALAVTLVAAGVLGVAIHTAILRPLRRAPVWALVMATFGVASMLDGAIPIAFGPTATYFQLPWQFTPPIDLPGAFSTSPLDVATVIISVVVLAGLFLLVYRTPLGTAMRASAGDSSLASWYGVNPEQVARISWAIAGMTAALAGVLFAARSSASLDLTAVGLTAFAVMIVGGLESLTGAVVVSFGIAFVGQLAGYLVTVENAVPAIIYGTVLLVILVRPYGLFGSAEIRRL